jgi:hypothetical protein
LFFLLFMQETTQVFLLVMMISYLELPSDLLVTKIVWL